MKIGFIRRAATIFLLLLVMYQQVGAGLYIHNLFHSTENRSHDQHNEAAQEIKFACSCVDNFLMPVTTTDDLVVAVPVARHITGEFFYTETACFFPPAHPTLRGPPAFIA